MLKNNQKVVDGGQNLWYYNNAKKKGGIALMSARCYKHQLDAKNRMRIPAKFREELGDDYTVAVGTGGCLTVYTSAQMKELKEKLKNVRMFDEKAMKPARILLATSWDAEEDKQGRILIPENLRKYAKINKDVIVLKSVDCIEIWAEEVWNEYCGEIDFSALADSLGNLG